MTMLVLHEWTPAQPTGARVSVRNTRGPIHPKGGRNNLPTGTKGNVSTRCREACCVCCCSSKATSCWAVGWERRPIARACWLLGCSTPRFESGSLFRGHSQSGAQERWAGKDKQCTTQASVEGVSLGGRAFCRFFLPSGCVTRR